MQEHPYVSTFMYKFEHIQLPAKLLDNFLRSNKSNINLRSATVFGCEYVRLRIRTLMLIRICTPGLTPPFALSHPFYFLSFVSSVVHWTYGLVDIGYDYMHEFILIETNTWGV